MPGEPLKLIGLLNRRPDLSLAQFAQHWRTIHRDLSLRLIAPGLMDGYVQNHRVAEGGEIEGLPLAGDGFPELWTTGADVLARLGGATEYREGAYLDEGNFMDGRSQALLARAKVIDDGPGRMAAALLFKVMLFFRRDAASPRDAFGPAFLAPRHPLLLPVGPRPQRLTRHVSIELPGDAGAAYDGVQTYDGVEASYWNDLASFRSAWSARSTAPAGLIDPAATVGVIVREEPVLYTRHVAAQPAGARS